MGLEPSPWPDSDGWPPLGGRRRSGLLDGLRKLALGISTHILETFLCRSLRGQGKKGQKKTVDI